MLFATAQTQIAPVLPAQDLAILQDAEEDVATDYVPAIDGGASRRCTFTTPTIWLS
jgi:hypothetical protein